MSIFKPVNKAAKLVFVTTPQSIFGWELNKRLFLWIKSFWVRSANPACPECDNGVMIVSSDVDPAQGQSRQTNQWICNHCGYALLEASAQRVRSVVNDQRLERAKEEFSEMEIVGREQLSKKHRVGARIFFGVALPTFAYAIYMIGTGVAWMPTLNWLAFALMFWVFGMKRAYRSWQVLSGHIFENGAFWHWFRHEKWLT